MGGIVSPQTMKSDVSSEDINTCRSIWTKLTKETKNHNFLEHSIHLQKETTENSAQNNQLLQQAILTNELQMLQSDLKASLSSSEQLLTSTNQVHSDSMTATAAPGNRLLNSDSVAVNRLNSETPLRSHSNPDSSTSNHYQSNLLALEQSNTLSEYKQLYYYIENCLVEGERSHIIKTLSNIPYFITSMFKLIELSFTQLKHFDYYVKQFETLSIQIIEKTNAKFEHFNYFQIVLERSIQQILSHEYNERVAQSWLKFMSSLIRNLHPICLNYKYSTEISLPQDFDEKVHERFVTSFSNGVNLK